ncbi:MAG: phosphatase PAP2 family protein [Gaiellales bacterium]
MRTSGASRSMSRRTILPKGWRDFITQLLLFAVVDIIYEGTRSVAHGSVAAAFTHARDLVSVEQTLGIFNELDVQHFAINHTAVLDLANFTYFHAHFAITTGFLFWLYLRRNEHYYFIRNMVFAADAIALAGFVLFPTAPPRMLTDLGFTDTLEKFATLNHDSGPIASLANPFAAVPSIHTCYSLITGITCFYLVRRRALRITWLFYPALIVFSIVATANHFWLDAILGAVVAGISLGIAWLIERKRPTLPTSARRRLKIEPPPAGPQTA